MESAETASTVYWRFKEQLLYLFFGGITTLLSIFLFWLFTEPFRMEPLVANIIGWIVRVVFAYVTNRTWVFKEKSHGLVGVIRECVSFFTGRLGRTGAVVRN